MAINMQTTRFVCISDTHNASPLNGTFKLPKGDVLIHAGDLSNQGSLSELRKTVDWIEKADFKAKIVVAGNHDITLDTDFYKQHGQNFHNQRAQDPRECLELLKQSSSITYLHHEATTIRLPAPDGYRCSFKVFGSPYSPANGLWAFGYSSDQGPGLWSKIPLDTDVVITHTPPHLHCDETRGRGASGCEALRQTLWRVRPRLAVSGHIHEGRGAEVVKWDLGLVNVKYKEKQPFRWDDPGKGNKKQSLLNLTSKSGRILDNDGSIRQTEKYTNGENMGGSSRYSEYDPAMPSSYFPKGCIFSAFSCFKGTQPVDPGLSDRHNPVPIDPLLQPSSTVVDFATPDTWGRGGEPPLGRCDLAALSGRLGRKETCVINAAIMASSWPHNGSGGKIYNKPIVVDINLPLLADAADENGLQSVLN